MSDAIVVHKLGKRFRRYDPNRPWTLQERLFRRASNHPAEWFWGLRDVSFSVAKGRVLGLIGRNGAGKSTLLRLIGGIGRPEEGSVTVNGRISGLLDLGVGFHSDLTGRENVFISGVIGGLTRREVAERFDSIVAFAEMRNFIDSPLRTYSTGMHMRLAFSVAIHTDPMVMLVDEILAVGDISFQRKCLDRINDFKRRGCTIVLVSHDPGLVQDLCDDVLWLDEGRIQEYGPADELVPHYVSEMETLRRTPVSSPPALASSGVELRVHENRFGSLELEIEAVRILDSYDQPTFQLGSDGLFTVEMSYVVAKELPEPIFGVTILDTNGQVCYDINSESGLTLPQTRGRGRVGVRIEGLALRDGQYYVDVGAYEHEWTYAYDYHWKAYPLLIKGNGSNDSGSASSLGIRAEWSLR